MIDVESSLSSSENVSANVGYGPRESPEQDTGDSMIAGTLKVQVQHIFITKIPESGCCHSYSLLKLNDEQKALPKRQFSVTHDIVDSIVCLWGNTFDS